LVFIAGVHVWRTSRRRKFVGNSTQKIIVRIIVVIYYVLKGENIIDDLKNDLIFK
jgi:hypothetical protein